MRNVIPFALFTFDRLQFKAPPADIFEDLLGYSGSMRFVGFHYTGQAVCIEDGQLHEIGHCKPWSIWYLSLGVEVLRYYCFGYEGRAPEHLLILDRKSRALYAAPVRAGQDALKQQSLGLSETAGETRSELHGETEAEGLAASLFDRTPSRDNQEDPVELKQKMKRLERWVN